MTISHSSSSSSIRTIADDSYKKIKFFLMLSQRDALLYTLFYRIFIMSRRLLYDLYIYIVRYLYIFVRNWKGPLGIEVNSSFERLFLTWNCLKLVYRRAKYTLAKLYTEFRNWFDFHACPIGNRESFNFSPWSKDNPPYSNVYTSQSLFFFQSFLCNKWNNLCWCNEKKKIIVVEKKYKIVFFC